MPVPESVQPDVIGFEGILIHDGRVVSVQHASVTVYTMVEMAKAHGLNVEKHLTFLLEKRPHSGMPDEDLEKLVPWSDEARAYCGYAQQIACI